MGAAVVTLNSYTKTLLELRRRQGRLLEETRAAPSYDDVVSRDGISVSGLLQCQGRMTDSVWAERGHMGVRTVTGMPALVLVGGCRPQDCEDCQMEMDGIQQMTDLPC